MKKSKSAASNVANRPKVDRADTYPGRSGDQLSSTKNATTTTAAPNRKLTNPRNGGGGGAAGGNGVFKWLRHITDAADSYKNKDVAKSKKTAPTTAALDSPTAQLDTIDEMLVMDRTSKNADNENSQRQEYDDANDSRISSSSSSAYSQQQQQRQQQQQQEQQLRKSNSYQEPVGRVEVMRFEEPELVQPDEVTISLTPVIDKQDITANPVEFIKEKNRTIEVALAEKKNLLAKILQIPVENYDHISEVVDEIRNSIDVNELILSSLTQADKLTMLISKHLDSNLLLVHKEKLDDAFTGVNDDDDDDDDDDGAYSTPMGSPKVLSRSDALPTPTPSSLMAKEIPVALSSSQLMAISVRLRRNLTQLMEVMTNRDREEKERPKSKRSQSNGQFGVMTSSRGQEAIVDVSRDVSVSYAPEIIEPLINRRGECVASLSVVDPILTERLEVIEPETFVMDCSRSTAAAAAAVNLRKDGATKTEADRGSDYYSTRTSSS